jgi:ribosomal protein S18 acetylase RimI-like enzyme
MDERADLSIASPLSGDIAVASPVEAGPASSEPQAFRTHVRRDDVRAVEDLVRRIGIFNDEEVDVARELTEEALAKGQEESGYYFLFADGEHGIEGYACLGPIPGTHGRCELYWIAVDPEARRRGLGRRLQHAAEDLARDLDAVYLIAETSTVPAYAPARSFYLSGGFILLAEIPDWHDDGDGMAIFRKRL